MDDEVIGEHIEEAIRRAGPDPRLVLRQLLRWSNLPMGRQIAIEAQLVGLQCEAETGGIRCTHLQPLSDRKCDQIVCTRSATHAYIWPGTGARYVSCFDCAEHAKRVVEAMGLKLEVIELGSSLTPSR